MHAQIRPHPDVIAQLLDGEMVLLHVHTNQFYELNGTASRMWQLLQDGLTPAQIRQHMLDEYDVQPEQLECEMLTMLQVLYERELVVTNE